MKVSFEGIGQVCATFLSSGLTEGQVVKLSGPGTVAPCAGGDAFCGVAVHCAGDACAVQVRGFASVGFTGSAPSVGKVKLCADGKGGVQAGEGGEYLVVDVDAAGKTATILL